MWAQDQNQELRVSTAIGKIRERYFKDKAQKAAGELLTEDATIFEKY